MPGTSAGLPAIWKKHTPQQRHRSGALLSVEHAGIPRDLDHVVEWFGHRVVELAPALGLGLESEELDDPSP